MMEHGEATDTSAGAGSLPLVKMKIGLLPLWGGFATLAMLQLMRGTAWPTALFFIAGWLVPIPIVMLLWRAHVWRLPRLYALAISLVLLGGFAWIGKHPSAERAFFDVTDVPLPRGVQVIRVERGWYDGRTTVVRFKADPQVVRSLMLQVDSHLGSSVRQRIVDEDMRDPQRWVAQKYERVWSMAVVWATPISADVRVAPPWAKPRQSHWIVDNGGGNRGIGFLWDDASGEALVYDGTD